MRIAVTGGTGFIGSHFLNLALDSGCQVLALRRSWLSKPRVPLKVDPIWLDRRMDAVTSSELQGCEVLVHLASHSSNFPYDGIINCIDSNLTAVLRLFEVAREAGIKRYIVAGSCFEYGRSADRYEMIPTYAPLEPTNSYSASKATASIALKQWSEQHRLSLEIIRVFHVFGQGELETRFWPALKRAALAGEDFPMTKGEQIREFIPVKAVSRAFLNRACFRGSLTRTAQTYNLGSGAPMTLRHFSDRWWAHWQAKGEILFGKVPYRDDEVMRYVAGDNLIIAPHK